MDQHIEQTELGAGDTRADLVSSLEIIEAQPLAARAAAYGALHDTLSRTLDSGPAAVRS